MRPPTKPQICPVCLPYPKKALDMSDIDIDIDIGKKEGQIIFFGVWTKKRFWGYPH